MIKYTVLGRALLLLCGTMGCSAEISNLAVTHGATFQPGLPARGSIATAFCKGLTNLSGTVTASGFPLPRQLAGVRVLVGGTEAPLLLVAQLDGYQQINFQVPLQTGGNIGAIDAAVTVEQGNQQAAVRAAFIDSPGEFFRLTDTRLYPKDSGVFQHVDDFSAVRLARPAKAGELLTGYLTGLGPTIPAVGSGLASPMLPPAKLVENPPYISHRLAVGGQDARILYVGLTPGLAGVYQVNFIVPQLAAGVHEVQLIRESCAPIFSTCPNPDSPRVKSTPATLIVQ
jgi:uncharacterized protein (TIGR03437 family)